MLDINEYGVVALDENALATIEGGDGGCEKLAYAIGYAVGWVAAKVVDGVATTETILMVNCMVL